MLLYVYMLLTLATAGSALWKGAVYPGIAGLVGPTLCWFAASGLKGSLMVGTSRQKLAGIGSAIAFVAVGFGIVYHSRYWIGLLGYEFTGVTWCLVGLVVGWKSKNPELHPAVVIDLNTGLRRGELLELTWDRVDLSRSVIRLEITKSGRRREVPINDACYRALVSLQPKESGRVFKTRKLRTAYENAVETAQLDDVTFHTLRHTFASWAMMRGASLKELQELLGHASLTMTMRYAHLSPDRLRSAVSRLDGLTPTGVPAAEIASRRAQGRAHEGLLEESLSRK